MSEAAQFFRTGQKATLTVRRPEEDVTVHLQYHSFRWWVITAIDEYGLSTPLSPEELAAVKDRAARGEDETGY